MIRPNYYDEFRCIADQCRHTCCAGWEIDIDEETLALYEKMEGPLGQKLKENIVLGEEPHFKLGEKERCPFLNEQNLCEIILECGEENLCQICSDHPRFRNELNGEEEIGVGLCCEAAAKLILGKKEKCVFLGERSKEFADPLEEAIYQTREEAFLILQDRRTPIEERAEKLMETFEVCLPKMTKKEWLDFYFSLERMDEEWTCELQSLWEGSLNETKLSRLEIPMEQFLVYLVYRHLAEAQDFIDIKAQIGYVYINFKLVRYLCRKRICCNLEDFVELARLFSSEIEYSQENTDEILERIWEVNEAK